MLPNQPIEIVAAWETLDADNYETAWEATEVGLNYFWAKHKAKVQFNYRLGQNDFGVRGDDADTFLVQFQYVF